MRERRPIGCTHSGRTATAADGDVPPTPLGVRTSRSSIMGEGTPHQIASIVRGHAAMHTQLWLRLRAITESELDWPIHPHANTVRWIVSHLLFVEVWTADMLEGSGTYLKNQDPKRYEVQDLRLIRTQYRSAFVRTQRNMLALRTEDLDREIDMLGVMTVPLLPVLENHVHHAAGHMYQIRFIRGTYAREHGTDKSAFDEW